MYYVAFMKSTKRVVHISKEQLSKQPNNYYGEVEFYGELPQKYDYLTIENLQEKTDTWTEKEIVESYDDNGNLVTKEAEVPKSRTYNTCELVANFRPAPTPEQIEKQKEAKYKASVTSLVRKKYDANAVEALLANYAEDKEKYQEEFSTFAAYRKECKAQARAEVYGN